MRQKEEERTKIMAELIASEELLQKKLEEKMNKIQKLQAWNLKLKQEIENVNDEMWRNKNELSNCKK